MFVIQKAYVAAEVPFLMDLSDTILAYEKKGFNEPFGQHPLIALTSTMDRVQQLEVIYGEQRWWMCDLLSASTAIMQGKLK